MTNSHRIVAQTPGTTINNKKLNFYVKYKKNKHMRIWSIHPKYLDTKGIVALWREALLAKKVLEGKTSGYINHPQLVRFKKSENPSGAINHYLAAVYNESTIRNYNFDKTKINWNFKKIRLPVTDEQLHYEFQHLLNKLKIRDKKKFLELKKITKIDPHPVFFVVKGFIEDWEKINYFR